MKTATYFPQYGHVPYEPTEEEIYGTLVKEIQSRWTETERLSRGYDAGKGVVGPGIKVVQSFPSRVDGLNKKDG